MKNIIKLSFIILLFSLSASISAQNKFIVYGDISTQKLFLKGVFDISVATDNTFSELKRLFGEPKDLEYKLTPIEEIYVLTYDSFKLTYIDHAGQPELFQIVVTDSNTEFIYEDQDLHDQNIQSELSSKKSFKFSQGIPSNAEGINASKYSFLFDLDSSGNQRIVFTQPLR